MKTTNRICKHNTKNLLKNNKKRETYYTLRGSWDFTGGLISDLSNFPRKATFITVANLGMMHEAKGMSHAKKVGERNQCRWPSA